MTDVRSDAAPADAAAGPESASKRARDGLAAALAAYLMWGFLPIYFKILKDVPALEVLVHRIVWAVPFGALIIAARRQTAETLRALTSRSTLPWLLVSASVIGINWFLYIYAVQRDQVFQASLGYYINPMIYVLVGVLFFGERLRGLQTAAVLLAGVGVTVLTVSGGQFPAIALALAVSFTIYGVIRKQVVVGGMPGLFVETAALAPAALGYAAWLGHRGVAAFAAGDTGMNLLLALAGPITVLPLLCFALAARRLMLTTMGMLQFIAPTLQFAVGVYYGEPLTPAHIVCFGCIWLAISLFIGDVWRQSRRLQALRVEGAAPAAGG